MVGPRVGLTFDLSCYTIFGGKVHIQEGEVQRHLCVRVYVRVYIPASSLELGKLNMEELFRKNVPVSLKSSDRDER